MRRKWTRAAVRFCSPASGRRLSSRATRFTPLGRIRGCRARKGRCRPSWSRPETIHVTLAFLGQKPRTMIDPMREALREVTARFAPLVIEIKGLGVFPNWQRPRVLWAGLRERTHQIDALHQAVERCLERFDYEPEAREYRPHLTLARFGGLRGVNAAQGIVMAHKDFRAPTFDAPACMLFESELHPSGARHTALDHFEFTKPSDSATHENSTV